MTMVTNVAAPAHGLTEQQATGLCVVFVADNAVVPVVYLTEHPVWSLVILCLAAFRHEFRTTCLAIHIVWRHHGPGGLPLLSFSTAPLNLILY